MTSPEPATSDADRLADVLQIYADVPLDDGDVVLLLDDTVCLELEQLATEWDDQLCQSTAHVLRQTASRAVLAIARPGAELQPGDRRLGHELQEELHGSGVELVSVQALPAA